MNWELIIRLSLRSRLLSLLNQRITIIDQNGREFNGTVDRVGEYTVLLSSVRVGDVTLPFREFNYARIDSLKLNGTILVSATILDKNGNPIVYRRVEQSVLLRI